jgi:hypothetical protein
MRNGLSYRIRTVVVVPSGLHRHHPWKITTVPSIPHRAEYDIIFHFIPSSNGLQQEKSKRLEQSEALDGTDKGMNSRARHRTRAINIGIRIVIDPFTLEERLRA